MTHNLRRKLLIQGFVCCCVTNGREGDISVLNDRLDELGHKPTNSSEVRRITKQMGYTLEENEPYCFDFVQDLTKRLTESAEVLHDLADGERDCMARMLNGAIRAMKRARVVIDRRGKELAAMDKFKADKDIEAIMSFLSLMLQEWPEIGMFVGRLRKCEILPGKKSEQKARRGFIKLAKLVGKDPADFNFTCDGNEEEVKLA
jgi:hypothetical protein